MKKGAPAPPEGGFRFCQGVNKLGKPCKAPPGIDRAYCWFHDPQMKEHRAETSKYATEQRHRIMPPIEIEGLPSIKDLIVETINRVRQGRLDPKVANAISGLARVYVAIVQAEDIAPLEGKQWRFMVGGSGPGADIVEALNDGDREYGDN